MNSHDAKKSRSDVPQSSTSSYWWFQGESVEQLYAKLQAMDAAGSLATCVFKCRPTGDGKIMLSVHQTSAIARSWTVADNDEINDSHICPPICP